MSTIITIEALHAINKKMMESGIDKNKPLYSCLTKAQMIEAGSKALRMHWQKEAEEKAKAANAKV